MDTQDLALFLEVARAGSFAAVARQRGTDPSLVSRGIAGLEADLGVRLFQRSTRRLSLTEAGESYLTRAAPLLEELERIATETRGETRRPGGTLRLSASITFGQALLLPLVAEFRTRYPEIALDCLFTDMNVDLVAERIDLAIRLAPAVEGDLVAARLMSTRYRVVAAPHYLEAAPALAVPADLDRHRVLLLPIRPFDTAWRFRDRSGEIQTVPVAGDIRLAPALSLRQAALDGLGPALLPDWLVDADLAAGRLVQALPEWDVTATSFDTGAWLVYPSRSFLPVKVRAMIDFLRARIPQARPDPA